MNPKSTEFKAILSDVRARYATAKRRGTDDYITTSGCNYICSELDKIIAEADDYSANGDHALAYAIAVIVLQKCGWLSSYADSSSGWLNETVCKTQETIRNICKCVEQESEDGKYIFIHGVKDCRHKDFDGWEEYPYGLLRSIAILTTDNTEGKLYEALDALDTKFGTSDYSGWLELGSEVRYEAILATAGEIDADAFLTLHIKYDNIRCIAIDSAIERRLYDKAEKLCIDRLSTHKYHESPYTRPSEWDYLLYNIYEKANNVDKQIETAEKILFLLDIEYFDILKKLLIQKGIWEAEYPSLLKGLEIDLPNNLYVAILANEGETRLLLEKVKSNPTYVFDYGKMLSDEYPTEIYCLCIDEIIQQASSADSRPKYKKVCGSIKKLYTYGGHDEAKEVIEKLKVKHFNRPAFLDELNKLSAKI